MTPDGTQASSRRRPPPEVVHVIRLKPFYIQVDCVLFVLQWARQICQEHATKPTSILHEVCAAAAEVLLRPGGFC